MHRMLLSRPDDGMKIVQQLHEIPIWQRLVNGPVAIVPLTAEGIAVVVNRSPPAKLRESIMIPLQDYKKYNLWGNYFFVKYHQGKPTDLTGSDIFTIKGLLGEPIPIELSVDLAAALGFKPVCQYEGCGFMEEHPAHTPCQGLDCGGDQEAHSPHCAFMIDMHGEGNGLRYHEFVKPKTIEVETISDAEAAKLQELQQSETSELSSTLAADQP